MTNKVCKKCGVEYPSTEEYFYKNGKWLRGECKKCTVCKAMTWEKENKTRSSENKKYWKEKNKEHVRNKNKEWIENNKGRYLQKRKEYRENNKEYIKKKREEWVALNPDYENNRPERHWAKDNPDRHRENGRKWRELNRERSREIISRAQHARRARLFSVGGSYTKEELDNKLAAQSNLCYYCMTSLNTSNINIEHLVPISRGGPNIITNIAYSCCRCNNRKHTKTVEEFLLHIERFGV